MRLAMLLLAFAIAAGCGRDERERDSTKQNAPVRFGDTFRFDETSAVTLVVAFPPPQARSQTFDEQEAKGVAQRLVASSIVEVASPAYGIPVSAFFELVDSSGEHLLIHRYEGSLYRCDKIYFRFHGEDPLSPIEWRAANPPAP